MWLTISELKEYNVASVNEKLSFQYGPFGIEFPK